MASSRSNRDDSTWLAPYFIPPQRDRGQELLTRALNDLIGQGNVRWTGPVWELAEHICRSIDRRGELPPQGSATDVVTAAMRAPGYVIKLLADGTMVEVERA